jgi:protein-tyrosine phosphatase
MGTKQSTGNDTRRLISLEAAHNFRDIGGYHTDDGRQTRWNLLYRADGLSNVTDRDEETLRPLGLRTVIDLRSHAELAERGHFPHQRFDVEFEHLPILDELWPETALTDFGNDREFLVWAYQDMLHVGAHRFAHAIRRLARPGAFPAVFHCTAGKDRTGLLAALLLSALGVRREDVLADYALTAAGIARMIAWAERESPDNAARLAATPAWYFAALPEALDHTLDDLCHAHGSIGNYVRAIGVGEHELTHLSHELLEARHE